MDFVKKMVEATGGSQWRSQWESYMSSFTTNDGSSNCGTVGGVASEKGARTMDGSKPLSAGKAKGPVVQAGPDIVQTGPTATSTTAIYTATTATTSANGVSTDGGNSGSKKKKKKNQTAPSNGTIPTNSGHSSSSDDGNSSSVNASSNAESQTSSPLTAVSTVVLLFAEYLAFWVEAMKREFQQKEGSKATLYVSDVDQALAALQKAENFIVVGYGAYCFDETLKSKFVSNRATIVQWVASGGNLITNGEGPLEAILQDWFGVSWR